MKTEVRATGAKSIIMKAVFLLSLEGIIMAIMIIAMTIEELKKRPNI
jgi:hypothetical protein